MPFRSKLKRALGGGGSGNGTSETSSLSKTDSKASNTKKSNLPDNVYKPGEPMPRPKYRGPWNQAHQDKLSAFRFGSFSSSSMGERRKRRSSAQASDYSPMGSKLPSRGPSQAPSRRGSAWSAFSGGSGGGRRGMGSRRQTQRGGGGGDDGLEEAAEGDTDVANVGLSRQHTAEDRPRPTAAAAAAAASLPPITQDGIHPKDEGGGDVGTMDDLQMSKTATQTNINGVPHGGSGGDAAAGSDLQNERTITNGAAPLFTADDLAKAMSQSTIKEGAESGRR